MNRITLQMHNALKATLMRVAALHPGGVLIYGIDHINQQTFCKLVKLENNIKKLLACTRIEIRGIGYHPDVEANFVTWLKEHIRAPSMEPFCSGLLSPHNWLKYNIAGDLQLLHLGVAKIDYFMILKGEHLRYFRDKAFNKYV